jgi:hypothetical protein
MISMARLGKRTLGIIAAATIIGGTATGVAVTEGTAHAQQGGGSISFVSATINKVGPDYVPVITFSVTCPAGDGFLYVSATFTQGTTSTGTSGNNNTCTGNPQTVTVQTDSSNGAPGQAVLGATLTFAATPQDSIAQIITVG